MAALYDSPIRAIAPANAVAYFHSCYLEARGYLVLARAARNFGAPKLARWYVLAAGRARHNAHEWLRFAAEIRA